MGWLTHADNGGVLPQGVFPADSLIAGRFLIRLAEFGYCFTYYG